MGNYTNILLVEHDKAHQQFFADILQAVKPSARLLITDNAKDAISFLDATSPHKPDVIFLAHSTPVIDGFEFMDILDESVGPGSLKDIPVVFLTSARFDLEKCYQRGVSLCISKPSSESTYRNMLSALLGVDIIKEKDKFRKMLASA
jgi:CheY-like chemotaxis protein